MNEKIDFTETTFYDYCIVTTETNRNLKNSEFSLWMENEIAGYFYTLDENTFLEYEQMDDVILKRLSIFTNLSQRIIVSTVMILGQITIRPSRTSAKDVFQKNGLNEIIAIDNRDQALIPSNFGRNEVFNKEQKLQIEFSTIRKNTSTNVKNDSDKLLNYSRKIVVNKLKSTSLNLRGGDQPKKVVKGAHEAKILLSNNSLTLKEKFELLLDFDVLKCVFRILFDQMVQNLKNIVVKEDIPKNVINTVKKNPLKVIAGSVIIWNNKLIINFASNVSFRQSLWDGVMRQVRLKVCLPPTCEVNQNDMKKCLEVIKDVNLMHEEKKAFLEKRIEIRNKVVHRQEKQVRLQKETNENLHEKLQKTKDQLNIQVDANVNLKMNENSLTQKLVKTNQQLEICLKKEEKEKPSPQIVSTSQPRFQERKERLENDRKIKKEAMEKEQQKDLEKNQQEEQQNLEKE